MTRYIFKQIDEGQEFSEYPTNMIISAEFDGDVPLTKILEGFKLFLMGVGFSEKQVENIHYGD